MPPVYLDYNATTPLDPRVFEVMKEWFLGPPANAGSRAHAYGQRAKEAVERARSQIASVIDVRPDEIVFTSGATESNNLAILGLAEHGEKTGRKHIISTAIEHKAVLEPLEYLARRGFEVELAPVAPGGYVEPDEVRKRLRKDTLLVSVMHANNETGILQPVVDIGDLVADSDAFFHIDAAQSFGKEVDELCEVEADLISVSSHKIFGPQGVGALFVSRSLGRNIPLQPLIFGGGQERGLRPGTTPVALAVGFGVASQLAHTSYESCRRTALDIRAHLLKRMESTHHLIVGDQSRCQPHVLSVRFPGIDSEALMMRARKHCAMSNGSACTSSSYSPSHVLMAMGMNESQASEVVRLSWHTEALDSCVAELVAAVEQLSVS